MSPATEKKIDKVVQRIITGFDPDKIILFGSHAWGAPSEETSDIDLFIIKDSPLPRIERARAVRYIIAPPDLPIDILVYTPQEVRERYRLGDQLIKDITEHGKILYEKPTA